MIKIRENFKINVDFIVHLSLIVLIIIVASYRIMDRPGPYMADEFGYLSSISYFLNYNWSEQIHNISYYGFGYGFLLAPFFMLFDNSMDLIHSILFFNVFLLIVTFEVIRKCIEYILPNNSKLFRTTLSFIVLLYTNNLVQVHYAWSETLILCLYWCTSVLLIKIIKKNQLYVYCLLAIDLSFLLMVHMRNVSIVCATLLVLFCFIIKEKKIKANKIICFGITICIGIIFFFFYKDYIQGLLWKNSNLVQVNEVSGQVGKIQLMFTVDGIIQFIKGVIGRYFYICSSSYFLVPLGAVYLFRLIRENYKNDNGKWYLYAFFLVSAVCSLGVAIVFMLYPDRVDQVLYGRYFETFMGPLIIFGFLFLVKSSVYIIIKTYSIVIIIYILGIGVIQEIIDGIEQTLCVYPCISGLSSYFAINCDYDIVLLEVALKKICIATALLILYVYICKKRKKMKWGSFLLASILVYAWVTEAYSSIDYILVDEVKTYQETAPVSDYLNNNGFNYENKNVLYYFEGDDAEWNEHLLNLQFCLGRCSIINVSKDDEKKIIDESPLFYLTANNRNTVLRYEGYYPVVVTKHYVLYKKRG